MSKRSEKGQSLFIRWTSYRTKSGKPPFQKVSFNPPFGEQGGMYTKDFPQFRVECERRYKKAAARAGVAALLALLACAPCFALTLAPGQSIASGIANCGTGCTEVLVPAGTYNESIVLNKPIMVRAQGAVTLRPGASRGFDVQCNNCGIEGFRIENFGQAASGGNVNRTNVTIRNIDYYNVGAGIWAWGSGWTIENVRMHFRARGGEDYLSLHGQNHLVRRCFFYGLQPNDLLQPDGSFKHADAIQSFVAGGAPGLQNSIIEENIFTDTAQMNYHMNESATPGAIRNITLRNNVYWGVSFPRNGADMPSHGVRLAGPDGGTMIVKNNLFKYISGNLRLSDLSQVQVEGNLIMDGGYVYSIAGPPPATVNRGTLGNLLWNNQNTGTGPTGAPDKWNTINPQLANANARGLEILGPDGLMFTSDDAWRPQNPLAAAYGPQVGTPPPPANLAPAANAGPDRALTLAAGQSTLTVALLGSGADADGTIAAYVWSGNPNPADVAQPTVTLGAGTHTFSLVVTDNLGLASAADTVLVTVSAAPIPPVAEYVTRAEFQAALDALNARIDGIKLTVPE